MTERERKLLRGGAFDPVTQDEAAIKYAIDNAGSGGGGGSGEETITINNEIGNVPETSDGYVVELEDARFAEITRESNIVINGHEMVVVADSDKVEFTYNLDPEGEPTGSPAIFFAVDETDNSKITYITDVDPSNSTLSIVVTNETGGGSSLPDPGAAGNVLTSTGDGWESAAPTGGDNTYWVDFEYGTPITTTTTCADVVQAVAEGKTILGRIDLGTQTLTFVCTSARADKCVFVGSTNERDVYVLVLVDEQGSPNVSRDVKAFVPVGSADGQTLVWDDDSWIAANNPYAPLIVHGTVDMVNGTAEITDDVTIADIVAAFTADRAVFFQAALGEGYYVRLGLFQINGTELTFSVSDIGSNAASVYTVEFDNNTTGTFNHIP